MVGAELAHLAVQGGQFLSFGCQADDDFAALHVAVVEGMHGLAVFQHHIVGNVHDVVDGPYPHGAQPLPHPLGRRGDLHVAHHPGGVPGHQIGCGGLHVQQVGQYAGTASFHHRIVEGKGLIKGGRHLPGQTDDGQAIGPVGGDLELHHMVVGVDHRLDVVAGLAVLVENEDAIGDAVWELRLLGMEVIQGADGVGLGVVGHQVPLVEIGAEGVGDGSGTADVQAGVEKSGGLRGALQHPGAHDWSEYLVSRLDVGGNGGLFWIQRLIVV